jgi:hypothetical protein
LDQKPKKQALLFKGVLKENGKYITNDDKHDRSTEFGLRESIPNNNSFGINNKVSRFSMSIDSDGFQDHLKRTGYVGVQSRNDAIKGNINKDLPLTGD